MKLSALFVTLLFLGCSSVVAETNTCTIETSCDPGHYCKFSQCGESGETGRCEVRPEVCTKIYQPVCGCDGKTYSNQCMAASQGISIRTRGRCDNKTAPEAAKVPHPKPEKW